MFPSLPLSREGEAGRRTQDGDAMCRVLGALSPLQVTFSPLETMRQTFSGQSPPRKRTRTEGSGWACAACTFVNEETEEVCVCDTPDEQAALARARRLRLHLRSAVGRAMSSTAT